MSNYVVQGEIMVSKSGKLLIDELQRIEGALEGNFEKDEDSLLANNLIDRRLEIIQILKGCAA